MWVNRMWLMVNHFNLKLLYVKVHYCMYLDSWVVLCTHNTEKEQTQYNQIFTVSCLS